MSLRLKINLVMALLTVLFAGAVIALQFRSMRESVAEETLAANRVASQLLNRTAWRYAAQGTPAMLAFLQGVGRVRSNDIWLYDADGRELYRSPPSPYKAGRDAPDWFDRLVSPPPSEQSIQFPDGKLLVRANASRAVLDAWDYLVVLGLASLALLVAVNALVFWIVGRTVRPFGRIVEALDEVQVGRFDVSLPKLPGREAGAIGAAFNRMLGVLARNIENERRAARAESQLSDSRELQSWIDHHIEQERRAIARELHDELGQSVTAIRSMALSVAQRMRGRDAESESAARLIADESSRLYNAMHGLIPRLAPLVLDSFGLADALSDLAERTRRSQDGLQIDLRVDLREAMLSADAALALYRAAQEGITNALRHGRARRIEVHVLATPPGPNARVTLDVIDDGVGLAAGAPLQGSRGHHGLRWLAERVHSLGGEFALAPADPHGVQLRVSVPQGEVAGSTAPAAATETAA
jgi:two-component system sensor histidine kinase UhpB